MQTAWNQRQTEKDGVMEKGRMVDATGRRVCATASR